MATELEDLRVLQAAEKVADDIWKLVTKWDSFAKDTVGKQLARAADSIGANIAEAYGRFHFGEKIKFLYYSRGSLFETKYWLNRAQSRSLFDNESSSQFATRLSDIARQINSFAQSLKSQKDLSKKVKESPADYKLESENQRFSL